MTWCPLPNFENTYEFDGAGRLRRIASPRPGFVLKPTISAAGYEVYYIQVSRGKRTGVYRHRLIALANVPNPLGKPCINHKDGDKLNNAIWNLEWVTHAENMAHAARAGLMRSTVGPGERSHSAKLDNDKVREIKRRLAAGEVRNSIAADFGVVPSTIDWIARGVTWAHIA